MARPDAQGMGDGQGSWAGLAVGRIVRAAAITSGHVREEEGKC